MNRKRLAFGLILLLIGTSVFPITAQNIEKSSQQASRGSWLYVGGSGPGNYSTIQSAIDYAFDGDTVFVYDDSSPYYENIEVKKSVYLIGENKDTTIINGGGNLQVITVYSNDVNISHFTFINSDMGILGSINNSVISNNIFLNDQGGIALSTSSTNIISENTIERDAGYNEVGIIFTYNCHNNIISHNYIKRCYVGIGLQGGCNRNIISDNTLFNNYYGMFLQFLVFLNTIKNNNFINNNISAFFIYIFLNKWTNNYWDTWSGIGPKLIPGLFTYPWDLLSHTKGIPFVNFDWHPVAEPYV